MDVSKKLDEIVGTVGSARSMPMSASCVVNRAELLAMLEEVRSALPGSLAQAQEVLGGREQVVEEARREAERIIESARAERAALIAATEIARTSQEEADRILAEARREAEEVRAEADDYVDSKLANFEVVLTKTIGSVDRGREKLLGRAPGPGAGFPDEGPERSADPETLRRRADEYVDAKLGAVSAVLAKTLEAVGRGRQKLLGARPADELGAHIAAQDAQAAGFAPTTSDADFLAHLAQPRPATGADPAVPAGAPPVPTAPPAAPAVPAQPEPYPAAAGHQQPQYPQYPQSDPGQGGYGHQQPYPQPQPAGPYATATTAGDYAQPDAYGWQQSGYGTHGGQGYGAADGQGYGAPDGQGYGSADGQGYGAAPGHQAGGYGQAPAAHAATGHVPQPPHPGIPPQPGGAALDETSFFDTSMINLDQLREYEQGR
ncbi:cell division initiation protein [Streptomyces pactum]|uniref:Cell division initiation protein n=1 Tax=Streptomyces pactum TaxID=68249 RepID=A0ABS0NPU3_9ACTN|nr:cell division initiation protein [Streptomyces pactum]MBH5337206.1 cell division initiation protein [Streptomyces pactum]